MGGIFVAAPCGSTGFAVGRRKAIGTERVVTARNCEILRKKGVHLGHLLI